MPDAPDAGYAFWTHPEGRFRIEYSLAAFHEIDFSVGEAYRSIPHGGMETGGLLFGTRTGDAIRIEAFRAIQCEHASGPSFVLSDRDLQALGEQIASAKSDPDLGGPERCMEPLGWFIAHTRSDLAVSDRELQWFDRFFPAAGSLTVLIKPERFQPTRFAFLLRGKGGQLERDGRNRAIILPLPGRASGSANGPVPSVPAPKPVAVPAPKPVAVSAREIPERQSAKPPETTPEPPSRPRPPVPKQPLPIFEPQPAAEQRIATVPPPAPPSREELRPAVAEMFAYSGYASRRRHLDEPERRIPTSVRLFVVLLIAAALGCAAGYWAYLQLPPARIPLNVNPEGSQLVVSWPPEQTRGTSYAAIRVNDGAPTLLSDADKAAGKTEIKYSGNDVKIELIVQHWMRQSRGIVRFVTAAGP